MQHRLQHMIVATWAVIVVLMVVHLVLQQRIMEATFQRALAADGEQDAMVVRQIAEKSNEAMTAKMAELAARMDLVVETFKVIHPEMKRALPNKLD